MQFTTPQTRSVPSPRAPRRWPTDTDPSQAALEIPNNPDTRGEPT